MPRTVGTSDRYRPSRFSFYTNLSYPGVLRTFINYTIMKNNKKEELQSRRDFFRKAAKATLPILGAIVLSQAPLLSKAATPSDCSYSCSSRCSDGCTAACSRICAGCATSCHAANCYHSCHDTCSSSCKGSCSRYSY